MLLPSFFKRKDPTADRRTAPAADEGGPVEAARLRARRRLIGAVVLLAIGVIGFPLVFETQPRPISLDLPIEPPKKAPADAPPVPQRPPPQAQPPVLAEAPPEAAPEPPPAAASAVPPPVAPAAAPPSAPAPAKANAEDGTRAKALLEGAAASQAKTGRFVVQVGAYTDAAALRDARQKVEKLGMKTYTQVVETDGGKRTRVRVGPFDSRDEANTAGAKLKGAGLPVAILTL